jgi:hypothetical protein
MAADVQELARLVIEAGGDLDDLKRLVELWEASANQEPTVAELSDDELLALLPGCAIEDGHELPGETLPCGCRQRRREWRLRGEAVDVTYTYVSNKAHADAVDQGVDVIPKGKRSGWTYETTPLGRGHAWQCSLCHPPAEGLDVEWRGAHPDPEQLRHPNRRLWWRPGYGWRRDGEPDGDLLGQTELSDEAFLRKIGGDRLLREWQLRERHDAERAGSVELTEPQPEYRAPWGNFDPNAPPIMERYADRPETRAEIEANARAWERLKAMSGPDGNTRRTTYEPPAGLAHGTHPPSCCCADGGAWEDGRCTRCWGWPREGRNYYAVEQET